MRQQHNADNLKAYLSFHQAPNKDFDDLIDEKEAGREGDTLLINCIPNTIKYLDK